MERINLGGTWNLLNCTSHKTVPGKLPGCNYLDLLAANEIEDPFWGQNENKASKIARDDYSYSRSFDLDVSYLAEEHIDLVLSGVDTLATITLNNALVGNTDNCHRTYRFDVKKYLHTGQNSIQILFTSPFDYIAEHEAKNPMGGMSFAKGIAHLRKAQCHFGWDWGPNLPPVGITGAISLEAYRSRIEETRILQTHFDGRVKLEVNIEIAHPKSDQKVVCSLTDPDGLENQMLPSVESGQKNFSIEIASPRLWWCNGLGEQPLYEVKVQLLDADGQVQEEASKKIGLRTIVLDSAKDEIGRQFKFIVNGVPIFAKGADWIPSDSFVNRTTVADLEFYIRQAQWANMNMLRVWGGGYYESDQFYELCDRYGILVWQDFAFACSAYPFEEPEFLENVHQEVIDNVKRLRHHASLALWCGNNENELMASMWKKKKVTYESNYDFYYNLLPGWVSGLDEVTPYWPGSPSSGTREINAIELDYGDSHLWGVWHGLLPVKLFRRMPARFTSEFGVESFPSMKAIRSFTDKPEINYLDPVMLTHQKSASGNQKILFYLIDLFRNPKHFEDFVYLSQLTQADAMRFATDEWRRHMGQCNGSIYWQYNDCWPVASWAGIDYLQQPKAVHYFAREFNKMVCLSNDNYPDRAEIYVENDLPEEIDGLLHWEVRDFSGRLISTNESQVSVASVSAKRCLILNYDEILLGTPKTEVTLSVNFSGDKAQDRKTWLLVADKYVKFPRPVIEKTVLVEDGKATITFRSNVFARYVSLELDGSTGPFSDNFFDLAAGEPKTICVPVGEGINAEAITANLSIKSLADVEARTTLLGDKLKQFSLRFNRINFVTWIVFKFITKLK